MCISEVCGTLFRNQIPEPAPATPENASDYARVQLMKRPTTHAAGVSVFHSSGVTGKCCDVESTNSSLRVIVHPTYQQ
eukprot:4453509-Pyramimonas_sp.AAC.1